MYANFNHSEVFIQSNFQQQFSSLEKKFFYSITFICNFVIYLFVCEPIHERIDKRVLKY
jgi:hypothetical protein